MDNEKKALMIERIKEQIEKIDNKDFSFYFYVADTKGNASGSLAYIYEIASGLQDMGYNVGMLHSEEDFVGVGEWLGENYAELPHYNIERNKIDISPSDFLFIPEVYTNVMTATRNLPCQRVGILQSFDKLVELIPFGAGWGDLGVFKAITTTETNAKRLNQYFPYVDAKVVKPKISSVFNKTDDLKKLIVNVVTRDQSDINKIVKPFFWQYPMYQWVAFRELRGLSREEMAKSLQEAAFTIWVDNTTDFGYLPLEAMKCGSIVVGQVPSVTPEWMMAGENLTNAGIWVDNIASIPSVLASVIRTWTLDRIPGEILEEADKLVANFTEGQQLQDIKNVCIDGLVADRRAEFVATLEELNNSKNEE